jgi:hypothetical protein
MEVVYIEVSNRYLLLTRRYDGGQHEDRCDNDDDGYLGSHGEYF